MIVYILAICWNKY